MDLESNISLENVINKINQLGKENDKNDFIKNYQEVKSKISIIDNILENKNEIDKNLSIDELFVMLEKYNDSLEKSDEYLNLDIIDFKKVKDIIELIEIKLNEKMNIIEIK
jgi:hypothetical protein